MYKTNMYEIKYKSSDIRSVMEKFEGTEKKLRARIKELIGQGCTEILMYRIYTEWEDE